MILNKKLLVMALLFCVSVGASALAETTLIHAGRLINGKSDEVTEKVTVVVEDNKIAAIEKGYVKATKGEKVIDLKSHTLMPGLMDMHTHLTGELTKTSYFEGFGMNPGDYAFRMVGLSEKTLMAGFTTVRDLGDRHLLSISLRKAISRGQVIGPRVYTAGKAIGTTGGHADPTNGLNSVLRGDPGPKDGVVNSPEDARKAVRQRYKDGSDLIKITATGGVLSMAKNGQNPQFTLDELVAIVETAKDYGFTVAAHAHGTEGMKRAVQAGVNSVEHGTYMDEEVMRLMKEKGTYLVPTLMAGDFVLKKAQEPGFFSPMIAVKAKAIGPVMKGTFQKAYEAGVKIAFGTDSGVSRHGENAHEFVLMVEAGMPPMKAIQSATRIASELLRVDDILGTVEAGKLADLVAVPGNPLENISLMEEVSFVMKDGKVFKQ